MTHQLNYTRDKICIQWEYSDTNIFIPREAQAGRILFPHFDVFFGPLIDVISSSFLIQCAWFSHSSSILTMFWESLCLTSEQYVYISVRDFCSILEVGKRCKCHPRRSLGHIRDGDNTSRIEVRMTVENCALVCKITTMIH